MEEFLSLFEYLNKPAGGELGMQVAKEAIKQGIVTQQRQVKTPRYEGKIVTYPKSFLDGYFQTPEIEPTLGDRQDFNDDLPF